MVWPHALPASWSRPRVPWRPQASRSPCCSRSGVQTAASSRVAIVVSAGASVGSVAAPLASLGLRTFLGFAVAPFASAAFKRLFTRRRRPRRPAPAAMSNGTKAVFSVASFNLRGGRVRECIVPLRRAFVDDSLRAFQACCTSKPMPMSPRPHARLLFLCPAQASWTVGTSASPCCGSACMTWTPMCSASRRCSQVPAGSPVRPCSAAARSPVGSHASLPASPPGTEAAYRRPRQCALPPAAGSPEPQAAVSVAAGKASLPAEEDCCQMRLLLPVLQVCSSPFSRVRRHHADHPTACA